MTAVVNKCPNSLCTQFSPLLDSMQGTNGGSADVLWFKSEKTNKEDYLEPNEGPAGGVTAEVPLKMSKKKQALPIFSIYVAPC